MASKRSLRAKAAISWLLLAIVVVGVPTLLVWVIGNPFPTTMPSWTTISRDIGQQNIPESLVVNTIALLIWGVWAQMTWAFVWELVVAGPRVAKGIRTRSAPLVAGPLASLATRIVSAGLAAGVVTSSQSSLPQRIIVAPDVAVSTPSEVVSSEVNSDERVSDEQTWLVQPGDSLWSISGEDQSVAAQIVALNSSISSPLDVVAGISLRVPTSVPVPDDRLVALEAAVDSDSMTSVQGEHSQRLVNREHDVRRSTPSLDDSAKTDESETGAENYQASTEATVVPGDTIWGLAEDRLVVTEESVTDRDVLNYVDEVVAENPEVQDNPDLIHPGQVIVLPSVGEKPVVSESQYPGDKSPEPDLNEDIAEQESNVVALPPIRSSTEVTPSPGIYDWATRTRVDLGLGVGGVLLGASALSLLRRRRQYRIAHRRRGTIPVDPDPRLDDIERLLQKEDQMEQVEWINAAISSLSARPVWENEHTPLPILAQFDSEYLKVTLAEPDEIGAPVPWESDDEGVCWRLSRSTPLEAIPTTPVDYATPTFVTIADGTLLNLEGVGVLRVEGGSEAAQMGVVRSIVHELATSGASRWVDIRSTFTVPGTDAYPLVMNQSSQQLNDELNGWLREFDQFLDSSGRSSTYAYRLTSPEEPVAPVVLVIDEADEPELRSVVEFAESRRLPIGIIQLVSAISGSVPQVEQSVPSLNPIKDSSVVLRIGNTGKATLEPFGLELDLQMLSESTANDLGLLLQNAASPEAAPLVANLQLSASVTSLADRHSSSLAANAAMAPGIESPWSVLDPLSASDAQWDHIAPNSEHEVQESADVMDRARIDGGVAAVEAKPFSTRSNVVEVTTIDERGPQEPVVSDPFSTAIGEAEKLDQDRPTANDAAQGSIETNVSSGAQVPTPGVSLDAEKEVRSLSKPSEQTMTALVLGEVGVVGFDVELTPQQLSLVTFLACVGEANRSTIIDALWDGKPISRSRFPNLLAETRAKIGRNTLPEAKVGVYRLQGVSTDLGQFEKAVAVASKQPASDAIETLTAALELVRGNPLTTPNGRYWTWIGDHTHLAARVESLISDAALRLCDLCVENGDLDGAIWACERGLLACPIDENLVASLAETYVAAGKLGAARRLVDAWEDKINRLECGEPSDGPRNRLVG